jgi:hypothetical protein
MQEVLRKFTQLDGVEAEVVLEHCLFDKQRFICPSLKTIEDAERIGLLLRGHKIFMYKQDIKVAEVQDDAYTMSDGRLIITVNKL